MTILRQYFERQAKREGKKEGRVEGRKEVRREFAKKLLLEGMDETIISRLTELDAT